MDVRSRRARVRIVDGRNAPTTSGAPVTRTLGAVRYTLALPAGYVLAAEREARHRWEPGSGEGLTVELTARDRDPATSCDAHGAGRVGGETQTIDGVERETAVSFSDCVEDLAFVLACNVEHTRGYLESREQDAGLVLCKGARIAR